jgi:hypothetical protein
MENLSIRGTTTSPSVEFKTNGVLKIKGRILTENAAATFAPMFEWISNLKMEKVVFNIELDYMNTSASMKMFDLLNQLEKNEDIGQLKVNWYYEEDDEDHLDTGKLFEQKLDKTEFEYVKVLESSEV